MASIINPSLTTMPNVNPSFRIYEMDSSSYEITDFIDYRMNVTKSNQERKAYWYEALRFTEYFEVDSMKPEVFNELIKNATVLNI